jgi:hypothetical protein
MDLKPRARQGGCLSPSHRSESQRTRGRARPCDRSGVLRCGPRPGPVALDRVSLFRRLDRRRSFTAVLVTQCRARSSPACCGTITEHRLVSPKPPPGSSDLTRFRFAGRAGKPPVSNPRRACPWCARTDAATASNRPTSIGNRTQLFAPRQRSRPRPELTRTDLIRRRPAVPVTV